MHAQILFTENGNSEYTRVRDWPSTYSIFTELCAPVYFAVIAIIAFLSSPLVNINGFPL